MSNVTVIIVNYNTKNLLGSCLQNLYNTNESPAIIVVDNASSDGSPEMIQEQFPAVKLMSFNENRGLTIAYNAATAAAQTEFILYLGSDAYPKEDVIRGIEQYMQSNPDVGIATAKLVLRDGQIDMDAHRGFPTPWASLTHFTGLRKLFPKSKRFNQYFLGHESLDEAHEIDLCISHFMFVRKDIFESIGQWDEDFFLYGEDVDLCYRTKEAGYKVMYLPQFEATHYKGATVGVRSQTQDISTASKETKVRVAKLSTKAMALFYEKHLAKQYPWILNKTILTSIGLLGKVRHLRATRST